ncbi:bicaudal D-related protein homolog isoform X2 [Diorhabda carinulata]|uniref:bicaudal D-related protein homolog isoform X3 n=1 Tax=Diorhabda sublineata TaxID=1163346 RepID=UPI0024E1748C|nr:bicaudal D-related protein homolog isoform X3 [Diorhabda sublineata]XP_057655748.1 bicaudal D-related protein homolog isoform X2 [Diorhabda carinulata]
MLQSLEEYIVEMENRSAIDQSLVGNVNEDVWTQLQQKENDLVLAAELGKALLEKNEELKKQKDALEEEFSKKIESIEQDRHLLRRKLHSKESELDAKIIELQNDVAELTSKLQTKDNLLKQWERDKSSLVAELTAQNTRLTAQLKEAAQKEQQLRREIDEYKERLTLGKNSLQEHMSSVTGLRDELELTVEKNQELERRLHMAAAERDSIALALEEASDRILMLERHAREQDIRYQQNLKEYSLPQEKFSIEDRLSEMDISEPTLSQECMSVYRQLRSLVLQLKSHSDDDSGLHSDCSTTSMEDSSRFAPGLLTEVAQELVGLVLDTDVVRILERLEQARREIQERDEELARRAERIMELNTRVSVCEVELASALEQRDRAIHDASDSSLAQDEVVAKARDDRDVAVQRRIKVEVELAKTRVELMQANSQLLETVQQKVELSQQLEQWQMDMHELLDEQLKNKLSNQEIKMKIPSEPVAPPRRRLLLRLFNR